MSKYAPFAEFLREQRGSEVPLTFAEIERVIGTQLPPSAKYPAWWSNNSSNNVMTELWLSAGFQTERVDIPGRKLVFRRVKGSRASQPADGAAAEGTVARTARRHPIFGCMVGLMTIAPGVDLTEPADPSWGAGR